jgi:putative peptidoglycan lipid II flippase
MTVSDKKKETSLPADSSTKMIRTTVILMAINLLAKFFGFLREVLLAQFYGASNVTDAYIIANNIPTVLFSAIGVALSTTFIPMYARIRENEGERRAKIFLSNLINVLLVVCLVFTILGEVFAGQFVRLFAFGFTGETYTLALNFTRLLFPTIFVIALINLFGSYLQLYGSYYSIGFVSIPCNVFIIFSLFASSWLNNLYLLAYGTLIGTSLQIVFYAFFLRKYRFYLRVNRRCLKDSYIHKLLPLILPVLLGEAIHEINTIIDRTLVSTLDSGSVSYLNYAYKLEFLCYHVLITSIMTIFYPRIAHTYAKKDIDRFSNEILSMLKRLAVVTVPLTVFIAIVAPQVVSIVFERGKFDAVSTFHTSQALTCYVIGLIGLAFREVLSKAFFVAGNTKTPMINGVISAILNIPLSFLFIQWMGHKGAALATSIVAIVGSVLLYGSLHKKVIQLPTKALLFSLLKTGISTLIAGCVFAVVYRTVPIADYNMGLRILLLCGFALAFLLVNLLFQCGLKNDVVLQIIHTIKGKRRKS